MYYHKKDEPFKLSRDPLFFYTRKVFFIALDKFHITERDTNKRTTQTNKQHKKKITNKSNR